MADTLKYIFVNESSFILIKISSMVLVGIYLTRSQNGFKEWLGAKQVSIQYLIQWWPSSLTHVCLIRPQWINTLGPNKHNHPRQMFFFFFFISKLSILIKLWWCFYTPHNKFAVGGGCWFHSVYPSIHPSICLSVLQIQPMRGWCVVYHFWINRAEVKVTQVIQIFTVGVRGILVDQWSKISSIFLVFSAWSTSAIYCTWKSRLPVNLIVYEFNVQ